MSLKKKMSTGRSIYEDSTDELSIDEIYRQEDRVSTWTDSGLFPSLPHKDEGNAVEKQHEEMHPSEARSRKRRG